jgi:hypothetical protein
MSTEHTRAAKTFSGNCPLRDGESRVGPKDTDRVGNRLSPNIFLRVCTPVAVANCITNAADLGEGEVCKATGSGSR